MIICENFIECCLPDKNNCRHRSPHIGSICTRNRCGFSVKAICHEIDDIKLFDLIEDKLNISKKQILSKIVLSKLKV